MDRTAVNNALQEKFPSLTDPMVRGLVMRNGASKSAFFIAKGAHGQTVGLTYDDANTALETYGVEHDIEKETEKEEDEVASVKVNEEGDCDCDGVDVAYQEEHSCNKEEEEVEGDEVNEEEDEDYDDNDDDCGVDIEKLLRRI